MKKITFSLITLLLLGAVACRKNYFNTLPPDRNFNTPGNVTNSEAADMAANSLSVNSNGVVNIIGDLTLDAASYVRQHLGCGTLRSDTISRQSPAGSTTTYSYNLKYNYIVVCTNKVADSLSSSLIYSGSFSSPNLSQSNSGSSIFGVSGLDSAATNYVINGEYKSAGSFQSKTDTASHGSNNVDIVFTSLTLSKPSRTIASGSATVSITGAVPRSGSFSYTGTLVFNGNGTATLTLNGTKYTINLNTGWWGPV